MKMPLLENWRQQQAAAVVSGKEGERGYGGLGRKMGIPRLIAVLRRHLCRRMARNDERVNKIREPKPLDHSQPPFPTQVAISGNWCACRQLLATAPPSHPAP